MRVRIGVVVAASMGLLVASSAPMAFADAPEEKRLSDKLFYEGTELMAKGDVDEACRKLEQSLVLLRRGGTLLNLALCREAQGQRAVALTLFEDAREMAARDGRTDRREVAEQHIAALRAKLAPPPARPAPQPTPPEPVVPPAPTREPSSVKVTATRSHAKDTAGARDRGLGHGGQFGASARVDVDPIHPGARTAVGLTYGAGDVLDVGLSALIGRDMGIEPQMTFFILGRSAWKPLVNLGFPLFFTGNAAMGLRGAAGVAWDPIRHLGLFAQVGGAYFLRSAPGYSRAVLLPSFGIQGRL